MKKYITILLLIIITTNLVKATKFDLGISVVSNFQTRDIGAGFRIVIKPIEIFRIVPQVVYYPLFYKIQEYSLGLGLELDLIKADKHKLYLLGNTAYTQGVYTKKYLEVDNNQNRWIVEGGIGFSRNKGYLRPFSELRFRGTKLNQSYLRIGLVYMLSKTNSSSSLRRHRSKTMSSSWSS